MNRSLSFSVSLIGHVTCVGLLLLTGRPGKEKPIVLEAYRVTLLAPGALTAPAPRSEAKVKAPVRRQTPKKASWKPRPKPVVVTRRVGRPKPAARVERSYDVHQLSKLETEALPSSPRKIAREVAGRRLSVATGGSSSFDAYIAGYIKSNWVRPSRAAVGQNPRSVSVGIRIAMDGRISRTRVTESSGIGLLDASAVKAIQRSNPLPIGLPRSMGSRYYDVTIVFQITDEA